MNNDDPTYALGRSSEEHQRLTEQAALFLPLTERFFRKAGLGSGMRVLDVGSGAGDVAFLVAELVGPEGEVVGIDLDGSALERARERASLLNLSNVKFVEGDVRSANIRGDFDAAVGRFFLMYLADPVLGLAAIVNRLRNGGLVAFQEPDMNPDVSLSFPEESLWNETCANSIRTMAGAGVHMRMGCRLLQTFVGAGLPVPSLMEEVVVGGGPDFRGYSWLANTMRSLLPMAERLDISMDANMKSDSLADWIKDDAVTRGLMVWSPPMVGAFARRSQ